MGGREHSVLAIGTTRLGSRKSDDGTTGCLVSHNNNPNRARR